MLWIRGSVFTAVVPVVIGFILPSVVAPHAHRLEGIWNIGWFAVAAGATVYVLCLFRFLAANGTPAIFFARRLRFLIGEEPNALVAVGLYRFTRNPMYVGVLLVVFGQAMTLRSAPIAVYGCVMFAFFHAIVVFAEEPHLHATRGQPYEQYCHAVPRWLGRRRPAQ